MKFLLNIGLMAGSNEIAAHVAREILVANDLLPVDNGRVHQSDTEPTLVIEIEPISRNPMMVLKSLNQTAIDLQQECIAVYRAELGKGALVGPKAREWGPFNPAFFLMPDGTRLGTEAKAA